MQAKIRKDGDVTVVDLSGRLDFESAEPFRETCQDLLLNSKVVFNLKDLNFVGSSGLGSFVNTLREFSQSNPVAPRFCHVRSEFKKLFDATGPEHFKVYDDENTAVTSFNAFSEADQKNP
ncbi:MAG: STAS domain-containing protein [Oligoflexia bacterium]|nr:STAS domain-containing protein [Oligoflexia bacterium]